MTTAYLAAAAYVAGGQWENDPYDLTEMEHAAKGYWQPDSNAHEFSVIVMPDTQYLFDEQSIHPVPMQKSFEYILSPNKSREDKNIVFVAHLGDVVQNGKAEEFAAATKVFDYLDKSGAEYSVLAGNHDIDQNTDDRRGNTPYLDTFHPSRFHRMKTWRDSSPGGYNNYYVFKAGGREWLLLALDWRMSDGTFAWANDVLNKHSDLPTILTTHELVTADSGEAEFSSYGKKVWDKLVDQHDQIFLTLNGHFWPPGRLSRKNAHGNKVDVHITNYQNRYYGGAGMIRAYRFNLDENKIDVVTFSPWIQELKKKGLANKLAEQEAELTTDVDHFTMHIDFDKRFKKHAKRHSDKVLDGTQAYWRFDGGSDGMPLNESVVVKDLSGHGNDLVLKSHNSSKEHTLQWSSAHHPAQIAHASLNFTGQKQPLKGQYLQTHDDAELNRLTFENGYTVEAFFYLPSSWNSDQNAWSSMLSRRGSAGDAHLNGKDADKDEPIVSLSISDDRELQWRVYPLGNKNGTTNWGHEMPFDQWWHVAVVNNGTLTKMYVDGSEVARNPAVQAHGLTTLNRPWMLGGFEYGGHLDQIFYGSIGDVRIVDRPLALDEFMYQSHKDS